MMGRLSLDHLIALGRWMSPPREKDRTFEPNATAKWGGCPKTPGLAVSVRPVGFTRFREMCPLPWNEDRASEG